MSTVYFTSDFNKFFKELASNNNKEWFDANRERYRKSVKEPFEKFVNDLIIQMQKKDKTIKAGAKDCIFRINRDIRFSKDKTPYKIAASALITPGGRKDMHTPGFYIEFGPEKIGFYGGAYFLETAPLAKIRSHIAKNAKEFDKLIADKAFIKMFGKLQGEESSRVPKELKVAAERQPLILRKQFYFGADVKPSHLTGKDFMKFVMEHHNTALPMMLFLRKGLR